MEQKVVITVFTEDHWVLPEPFESSSHSSLVIFWVMAPFSLVGGYKRFGVYAASIFISIVKMKMAGSPIAHPRRVQGTLAQITP
jgi:hypothetical protein